jgi:hypothetical protein
VPRLLFGLSALALLLVVSIKVAHVQNRPFVRYANPGEAATGEVGRDGGQEIQRNTRPCDANSIIVIFRRPYSSEPAGTIKCGAIEKSLIQVIQQ